MENDTTVFTHIGVVEIVPTVVCGSFLLTEALWPGLYNFWHITAEYSSQTKGVIGTPKLPRLIANQGPNPYPPERARIGLYTLLVLGFGAVPHISLQERDCITTVVLRYTNMCP